MKIKSFKVFLSTIMAFAIIGTSRSCQDYKVKHESKLGNINQKVKEIKFEDVFIPNEEPVEVDTNSEIMPAKSK